MTANIALIAEQKWLEGDKVMPEFFKGTKWLVEEREAYWVPDITEKLVIKLPKCAHCGQVFGIAALDYNYCPQCGESMKKTEDKQNIEKELYKSFITRLIHCTDDAKYEEDVADDYCRFVNAMRAEYKEKYGEEIS